MPRVTIKIPTPLRGFVDGATAVEVDAATLSEALDRLSERSPRLQAQLFGDDGRLRRYVNVYVDGRDIREVDEGTVQLEESSEVRIVPSIAGGRPGPDAPTTVGGRRSAAGAEPGGGDPPGDGPGLTAAEFTRYSRHLLMPEVGVEGQKRLKAGRAILVGAGGLGSPAATYLAAAGVGRIGLVDHDRVDLTNLQRQILHDTDDIGRPKLQSARERLEALNPLVEVETFETRLDSSNALEVLNGYDVIVDGSDNFPTRYLVNDAGLLLGTPVVYGAIFRFEGQASVFGAPDGPCYRCLFREPPPAELVPNCAEAGVLGILPGIVGTIQATEAIKLILGRGETLAGRLLLLDALRMEFREVAVRRDPECPACGHHPTITELIDYEEFCGLGAAADEPADGVPAISVAELRRQFDDGGAIEIVDVREPYEWQICNLEPLGARLIPLAELPTRLGELTRETTLVVHCRTGARSGRAVQFLRDAGFDNARNLDGGILAWAREVDPGMPTY